MKSFKKLYTDFSVKEKENLLSLKPEEMLKFARDSECDTSIEEISSLLNSKTPFVSELSEEELGAVSGLRGIRPADVVAAVRPDLLLRRVQHGAGQRLVADLLGDLAVHHPKRFGGRRPSCLRLRGACRDLCVIGRPVAGVCRILCRHQIVE